MRADVLCRIYRPEGNAHSNCAIWSLTPWGTVEDRLPESSRFRRLCEGRHLNSEEKLLFVLPYTNEALQEDFDEGEKNVL